MATAEKVFLISPEAEPIVRKDVLENEEFKGESIDLASAEALGLKDNSLFLIVSAPVEFFLKNAITFSGYPEVEGEEKEEILKAKKGEGNPVSPGDAG